MNAAQTRAAESHSASTPEELLALMELAGEAAAAALAAFAGRGETLVLCGPGNNGGDGYRCATLLAERGFPVRVAAPSPPAAEPAATVARRWHGPVEPLAGARPAPILVDALFGIGLARPLAPACAAPLNALAAAARTVIALDLPSGIDADTGALLGEVPRADLTIAFGALKPAHLLLPAAAHCGRVALADIGLDTAAARTRANAWHRLPPAGPDTHKYRRGHLLVLGGPAGRGGAARLAAHAASRAGAGLVTVAVPPDAAAENAARLDSVMLAPLADARDLAALAATRRAAALVLGPGLGTGAAASALAEAALALHLPLVLDADIFTLFAGRPEALRRAAPTVLTPHEGEFARLMGGGNGSKLDRAREAAAATGAVVLLKGADSVIAAPDGRAIISYAPAPALATAGSGDVLAGAIGGLLAAGIVPFRATAAAAHAHGAAGHAAAPGLSADDLPALVARHLAQPCP